MRPPPHNPLQAPPKPLGPQGWGVFFYGDRHGLQTWKEAKEMKIVIGLLDEKSKEKPVGGLLDGEMESEDESGDSCPMATQDIKLNLKNRQKAIDTAKYGPLNPAEPNTDFWRQKANIWRIAPSQAKNSRCGNCAAFIQTTEMLNCIEKGLGGEEDDWDTIDAGDLGFCEIFDFKCAAARTCDAWVTGGPVTDESEKEDSGESDGEMED